MMRLISSRAYRYQFSKNRNLSVGRNFSWSRNYAAQDNRIGVEENPFKDYEYDIDKALLPCDTVNPACDVIQDNWVEVRDNRAELRGYRYTPVLCRGLYDEGYKALAAGIKNYDLRRGVDLANCAVNEYLRSTAQKIRKSKEIVQLATTMGDRRIGELMVEAVKKVGNNGLYLISVVKNVINELEFDNGMLLGWHFVLPYGPYLINDERNRECVLENPFILLHENEILNKKVVEQAIRATNNSQPLLIFAESAKVEFVESLGTKVCVVVPYRSRAEKNKAILEDLAIFTGGQVVTAVSDMNSISSMLGSCKEVRISIRSMIIIGGSGSQKNINERREQLGSRVGITSPCSELELLKERLANLSCGAAIFKVGGGTSVEMVKNNIRACNVVKAVKSAIKEGFVAGGGVALLHASKELDKVQVTNSTQKLGVQLFQHVLKLPVYSIASKAGFDGTAVIERLLEEEDPDLGYDPAKGEYVDMIKAGNMDPYKLISEELSNLTSAFLFDIWKCS